MKYVQIQYKTVAESEESLKLNQRKLAKLFKVPLEKIEGLFAKRPIVLMPKVEMERAKKIYQELQRHGIPCEAKPLQATAQTPPTGKPTVQPQASKLLDLYQTILQKAFRGHAWLMWLVVIGLPLAVVGLPLSNLLLTADQHIVYLGKRNGAMCADFTPFIQGNGKGKAYEKRLYQDYINQYSRQTNPLLVKKFGYQVCRVDYLLKVGNVGRKPVRSVFITMGFNKLEQMFPTGPVKQRILTKVHESNENNLTKVSYGEADNYIIQDLDVGSKVEFRFRAWYKKGSEYNEWSELLSSVESDAGKVEQGSPDVSPLERLLGLTK